MKSIFLKDKIKTNERKIKKIISNILFKNILYFILICIPFYGLMMAVEPINVKCNCQ